MKRLTVLLCLVFLLAPVFLFAQDLGPWKAAYGDWRMVNGRLTQLSTKAGMAQAYMYLPQSGIMQYEFDARYVAGAEDSYAGFGVHIGIDKACTGKSWGNGKSFLLWLTYDPKAYDGSGLFGQAYKSFRHSYMILLHRGDRYMVPASLVSTLSMDKLPSYTLPVKIKVNYNTGSVKVYDPTRTGYYYRFSVGEPIKGGLYISVRTNSLAGSFGNFKATRLDSF